MDIDPTTAEALRTVRKRLFVEEVAGQLSEGQAAEFREFVGAARQLADDVQRLAAAVMTTEQTQLPTELADALTVLLRYADRAPTASLELKEAVRTARSYLPRPFAAEDIPGLPDAIGIVAALAAKRYPGMHTPMEGWPEQAHQSRARYVESVLKRDDVLPLLMANATTIGEAILSHKVPDCVAELSLRLRALAAAEQQGEDALTRWAKALHEQIVELHGYLLGVPHRVPRVRP